MNPGRGKDELYRLVDALPEEKAEAAKKFLELLLGASSKLLPEKLVERLDLFERIIDSLPDATLAVDRKGKVLVWNRAMEEMTGVKREEILGRGEYAYAVPFLRGETETHPRQYPPRQWHRSGSRNTAKSKRDGPCSRRRRLRSLCLRRQGASLLDACGPSLRRKGNLLGAVQCIRDIGERKKDGG
ncbi:PAS domain S-box protein [Desulfofundulus sp. TPOSR]|uniref:PAS domain-containing protein n=1 Tax=Desulfofundulus sp. TPOSR TaxID=2714340 RepID=UPI0028BE7FB1|nr:PAS domain S-box protein [Desulfofundulus sp. TPOSR]